MASYIQFKSRYCLFGQLIKSFGNEGSMLLGHEKPAEKDLSLFVRWAWRVSFGSFKQRVQRRAVDAQEAMLLCSM
jgi:hypothetical protein